MKRLSLGLVLCALLLATLSRPIHAGQVEGPASAETIHTYHYSCSFNARNDHGRSSPSEVLGAATYLNMERAALADDNCRLELSIALGAALDDYRREASGSGTLLAGELELNFKVSGELRTMHVRGDHYIFASLNGQMNTPQGPAAIGLNVQAYQDKAEIPVRIGSYDNDLGTLTLIFGRSFDEMSDAFTLASLWPDGRYVSGETKPFIVKALAADDSPAENVSVFLYKDLTSLPIRVFTGKTDDQGQTTFAFDKGIIGLEAGPHNFAIHIVSSQGQLMVWHWSEDDEFLQSDEALMITARFAETRWQQGEFTFEHLPASPALPVCLTFRLDSRALLVQRGGERQESALPFPAVLDEGQLMVPARITLEQLGYQVDWLAGDNAIRISGHEQTLWLRPSNQKVTLNEHAVELTRPVRIRDGCALMPLRDIAELLGRSVEWDDTLQQAAVR